jgi:hypothetical protein
MMSNYKNWMLLAIPFVALLNGIVSQYLNPGAEYALSDIPFIFLGVTISFMWYYYDSEEIQYRRGVFLNIGIIAIGIIAFPYYFFRSRGLKKGVFYTAAFFAIAASWSLLQFAG